MTRGTIIIEDNTVSVTGNEIWMTATEIAGLFHTGVPDVYSLEIIIPVAFRLNTYHAHVFRTWLVEKALSKEKRQAYVMFIQNGKAGYC